MKKHPLLAVDAIILYQGKVLLVKRKFEPFAGLWALPGGFVNYNEKCEEAIKREVLEETGLLPEIVGVFGVYSDPQRDPRGHVVSIVFEGLLENFSEKEVKKGEEVLEVKLFSLEKLPELAFDHREILLDFKNFLSGE